MNVTTGAEGAPWRMSGHVQRLLIALYSLITVAALAGNSVVAYIVLAYKRMHTVPNYFLLNLALSDLLVAVFCIPFTSAANLLNYWPFGAPLCPAVLYVQGVTVFLSSYTLVAMSIDRYIVIVHPFLRKVTPRQSLAALCGIWLLALSVSAPTLATARLAYFSNSSGQCLEAWDQRGAYSLAVLVLHYFVPLALLAFSYTRIAYIIWVKNFRSDAGNKRRLQLATAKKKMIRMMITVVIFYALCWLPIHVITLVGDHRPEIYDGRHVPLVWMLCHWLAMSSSCYNPIIYIWMSPKFRSGLSMALQRCSRRRMRSRSSNENMAECASNVRQSEPACSGYCFLVDAKLRPERLASPGALGSGQRRLLGGRAAHLHMDIHSDT